MNSRIREYYKAGFISHPFYSFDIAVWDLTTLFYNFDPVKTQRRRSIVIVDVWIAFSWCTTYNTTYGANGFKGCIIIWSFVSDTPQTRCCPETIIIINISRRCSITGNACFIMFNLPGSWIKHQHWKNACYHNCFHPITVPVIIFGWFRIQISVNNI